MIKSRFQILLPLYGLSLALFLGLRLLLLCLSWSETSADSAEILGLIATGALFDSVFFAYAMVLPVLYLWLLPQRLWRHPWQRRWLGLVVFATLYAAGFVLVAEYFFWDEFSVRFNFISIDYLIYRREVTDNILQSYPVLPLLALLLVSSWLLYRLLRGSLDRTVVVREPLARRSLIALVLLLLPLLAYFGVGQPLREISSNHYVNELASNGPYQFVAAFRNNEIDYRQFYATLPEVQADSLLRRELSAPGVRFVSERPFDIRRDIDLPGPERKLNIVLVTVESLSSDFLGYFGNRKGLTPNLDGLIKKSLFFENLYATGTRTTRGLEAISLSIPPTPGRSIIKRLGRETDQTTLGNILDSKGYRSFFLYGGRSFFENMNSFFGQNGYEIVDQTTVAAEDIHFSNAWGMADEDLFDQALKVGDRQAAAGQPFFLHLMTTSNHRPYTYPDGRIDIPSGSGRDGAVKYTDWAIGRFLRQAAEHSWFERTLFVLIADHQAGSAGKSTLPIARYHIPCWIYAPKILPPERISTLASQIDLAPTLMGLLGSDYRSSFFGRDLLRPQQQPGRALVANYQNLGLFDGRRMAILEPQKAMVMQEKSMETAVRENPSDLHEPLVQRDISYYEGAAAVFQGGLTAWSRRARL